MSQKFDARQTIYRGTLGQLSPTQNPELDNLLLSADSDLTALLRLSANTPNSLVVNVGASDLLNAESNRRRAIPHIGTAYVQFASGTVTFPAASAGNITTSTGGSTVLNVASGNFAAVLIYLDGAGGLNTAVGADAASESAAITNLPPSPDETIAAGFIVVQNIAGVIQNIAQSAIRQFGSGSGGGGSGDASSLDTILRDRFANLAMKYLDPNIFRRNKSTKVDLSSTGSFDLVKNAFKFTSIGQTLVTTNAANAEFLTEAVDITEVELYAHWLLGFIDTAATYEVSRDGGTNWQAVTMARVGSESNAYRGYHVFNNESVLQNLQTVAATGAGQALNATTQQELSSQFVVASTTVLRTVDLQLNFGGVGAGLLTVKLVKNNAGSPSTNVADILSESNPISISSIASGNSTLVVDMPDVVIPAGTYHIVLSTNAAYKAGTLDLSWRSGTGTNGATFNGTIWTGAASTKAYTAKGRVHDLRIRITGSAANTFLEGYGLYFGTDDGLTAPNGSKNVQRFYFSGDENRTQFALNWTPEPDLLEVYDPLRGQVYMIEEGVARLSGQTVIFDADTFSFPGEQIVLVFKQVKGIAIDNSDFNAAKNSEQDTNLTDVGNQIEELDFVSIPKIAVPFTTITDRAQIPDLSQDLSVNFGVNRIPVGQIAKLENEFGPNGQSVFKLVNDRLDVIRFVGSWSSQAVTGGVQAGTLVQNDYVEITFYGTGLNILTNVNTTFFDLRPSIDGGAEGANVMPNASPVLNSRNVTVLTVVPVASNLALGVHTIRLRNNGTAGQNIQSIEILNETQNIRVRPGLQLVKGKRRTLSVEDLETFNSGFETGTLGTRGGRVVVYHKADGTIGKAVTPTDVAQLNLAAASHANEEVARVYNWREFGANRADDFSTVAGSSTDRAFTLDDGTTTLTGATIAINGASGGVALAIIGTGSITFTFVGTGLDVVRSDDAATIDVHTITVDGVNIGSLAAIGTANLVRTTRIVSGLPYGTHTVRITRSAGSNGIGIRDFIVYQPKTPQIPATAKGIAAYNLMANFVANATAGELRMSTGVLRKAAVREFTYVNGTGGTSDWAINNGFTVYTAGMNLETNRQNAYVEYTFFGTGFDFRFISASNRSANITVSLQALTSGGSLVAATTTNFPSLVSSVYGTGVAFNNSTGVLDQLDAAQTNGSGLVISGLPLGTYKVRFNNNTASAIIDINSLDIITPIHSSESSLPTSILNTLSVGSNAIQDLRKIKALEQLTDQDVIAQAIGVISGPTTTSTLAIPIPDLSVTVTTKTGKLDIAAFVTLRNNIAASSQQITITVNGQQIGIAASYDTPVANNNNSLHINSLFFGGPGTYKIDVYHLTNTGTTTFAGTGRYLRVKEGK